jgi:hypothetical protein
LEQSAEYLTQLDALISEATDLSMLALNTPSSDLAGPISDLQRIKREVAALDWPPCAVSLQFAAEDMMEQNVTLFLAFYSGQDDEVIRQEAVKFSEYSDTYSALHHQMIVEGVTAP